MTIVASVPNQEIVVSVPVEQIRPNPNQPREYFDLDDLHTLRVSIRSTGQIVPILLKPVSDSHAARNGIKFEIVDGERRWRAASLEDSEITHLNAIVKEYDDEEQFLISCAANFNRAVHTPFEELRMLHQLVKVKGLPQNRVAILLGKTAPWVSQRVLAYERLCSTVMEALKNGSIPITVATTLAKLTHADQCTQLKNYLAGGSLTSIIVAVQKATAEGKVQGGVRKTDAQDVRRYFIMTSTLLAARLDRLNSIGEVELRRSLSLVSSDEQQKIIFSLEREADRLMQLLKAVTDES